MKANRKGFTLVELLVVIGIVGILMGALFPAITAAMIRANLASCAKRGRNLYVAIASANVEREAAGLPPIWPRSGKAASSTGGGESRIELKSDFYLRYSQKDIADMCWGCCHKAVLENNKLKTFLQKAKTRNGYTRNL